MDAAVPAAPLKLSNNAKTAFGKLSDSMKEVSFIYDTDFRQLLESHEMETGNNLFGNGNVVPIDSPYNVRCKEGKENSEHDMSTVDGIRDHTEPSLEVMDLEAQ